MYRYLLCAVVAVLLLNSSAQAWAPYVGASEADNEFYRITPANMTVIESKKGMITSRSFGQNLCGGWGSMGAKNPIYTFYGSTNVINLLNYPTTPLTSMPTGFFATTSTFAPNNRILQYDCEITPLTNRIDHMSYYLGTAPYQYANDIADGWAYVEYHPDTGLSAPSFEASYKQKLADMATTYPNLKVIRVTGGLWPTTGQSDNEASWTFSDWVMNPANGLYGTVPVYDWRNILATHADGTPNAGHYMCQEFNTGDQTHPNQPFIGDRLGKALILLLYKIYCNPPLTANAGFDHTYYDTTGSDPVTVTLNGSASYDPGATQIVSYVWREGSAVLYSGASPTTSVSLAPGTHTLNLTVTNNATPAKTSMDPVVITIAKPKLVIANAGPDQRVINLPNNPHTIAEGVQFDGGGSTASGGRTISSYVWTDAGRVIGTGLTPGLNMETGVHLITLTVTDSAGNTDSATMNLNVIESDSRIYEGLQALYTFKEGSGTTVTDVSGCSGPLNMTIATPGAVTWTAGGGLTVNSETLIATPGAASRLYDSCQTPGDVTLEAWVQPTNAVENGPATILTMSADCNTRNFTLSQGLVSPASAACYSARFQGTGTDCNGDPLLASADGTATTALQHVVYSRQGNSNDSLYVNNVLVATGIHEGVLNIWNRNDRLALADEIVGGRPWLGKYRLVAFYNKALSAADVLQNYTVGASPAMPQYPKVLGWQAAVQRGQQPAEYPGLNETVMYTDCRKGALNTIWCVLSQPVNAATVNNSSVSVTGVRSGNLASKVSSITLDSSRRIIIVQMASMPLADRVTFTLQSSVHDPWGQSASGLWLPVTINSLTTTVGSLVGDVNGDGKVSAADLLAVRNAVGQPATGAYAKYDLDCSGTITGEDMLIVQQNLGATLP